MLRPKKKISKRELKQDALITSYARATSFYEEHKREISIGITAVVVVFIAAFLFFKNRADSNEKAMVELGSVFHFYDNGQYQFAVDGIPARNVPGLKSIVDNYGSTSSGEVARFYLASAYYQLGRYDEALEAFKDCSLKDEVLQASCYAGAAACYEAKGMHKEAAEQYEKAATKYSDVPLAAEYLNNAARNYGQAGEKEKAVELLKRLKKDFPQSQQAREADRFIAQFSV